MNELSELSKCFQMEERELCYRAGYSPFDVKRILQTNTTLYPAEFTELMNKLIVLSLKKQDLDIQTVKEKHLCRLGCLKEIAEEHGVFIGPCEDPHIF